MEEVRQLTRWVAARAKAVLSARETFCQITPDNGSRWRMEISNMARRLVGWSRAPCYGNDR